MVQLGVCRLPILIVTFVSPFFFQLCLCGAGCPNAMVGLGLSGKGLSQRTKKERETPKVRAPAVLRVCADDFVSGSGPWSGEPSSCQSLT